VLFRSYKQEGDAILKKTSLGSIFGFGKQQKFEDASAAYTKAGNAYKMSKQWSEAGAAFMKCAECQLGLESNTDICNSYVEAGSCFAKSNSPLDAIDPMQKAVDNYTERGRISQVSRLYKDMAEIYEKNREMEKAIFYYEKSADACEADNKPSEKQKMLLKIATICSAGEGIECDFKKAAGIFESMGLENMNSKLGAYNAKNNFFQAALCHMANGDNVAAGNKIQSFKQADFNFPSSRECLFLEQLLEAMDQYNAEDFAEACQTFDRITPLDPWKTSVLVKIKRHLVSAGDENNDEDLT